MLKAIINQAQNPFSLKIVMSSSVTVFTLKTLSDILHQNNPHSYFI